MSALIVQGLMKRLLVDAGGGLDSGFSIGKRGSQRRRKAEGSSTSGKVWLGLRGSGALLSGGRK